MATLDKETKAFIRKTINSITIRLCVIYNFKMKLPTIKSYTGEILKEEIDELFKDVILLHSMFFDDKNKYFKFVYKCLTSVDHIVFRLTNFQHLSDIVGDTRLLLYICTDMCGDFDSAAKLKFCNNGNKLLKLIKFKTPKA